MRKATIAVAVLSSVVGAAGGFFVGYKFAMERLGVEYDELLEEEIRRTRDYYQRNTKPFATPEEAAAVLLPDEEQIKTDAKVALHRADAPSTVTLQRVVNGLKYHTPSTAVGTETAIQEDEEELDGDSYSEYVVGPEEDPDYDNMIVARADKRIYLVTQEEHMENARDYRQISLTYYAGDNVLVDEEDRPIETPHKAIGHGNLQFGRWSGDDNLVYIRNEEIRAELEIALSQGKYSVEVLGLDSAKAL